MPMSNQSQGPALLRQRLAELEAENNRLKKLLRLTEREAAPSPAEQTAWLGHAPGPVHAGSSSAAEAALCASLFAACRDVYAVRWENARTARSGWVPAVEAAGARARHPEPDATSRSPMRCWRSI